MFRSCLLNYLKMSPFGPVLPKNDILFGGVQPKIRKSFDGNKPKTFGGNLPKYEKVFG